MVHLIEIPFLVNLDRLNYLMCQCAICPIPSFHKDFLLRIFPIVGSHDSILKAASCPPGRSQDSPETSSAVAVANQDFRITVEDEPLPPAPPPAPPIPKQEARKKKMIVSSHNKKCFCQSHKLLSIHFSNVYTCFKSRRAGQSPPVVVPPNAGSGLSQMNQLRVSSTGGPNTTPQ